MSDIEPQRPGERRRCDVHQLVVEVDDDDLALLERAADVLELTPEELAREALDGGLDRLREGFGRDGELRKLELFKRGSA